METRTEQLIALFEGMQAHAQDHLLDMAGEYYARWPVAATAQLTRVPLKLVPVSRCK